MNPCFNFSTSFAAEELVCGFIDPITLKPNASATLNTSFQGVNETTVLYNKSPREATTLTLISSSSSIIVKEIGTDGRSTSLNISRKIYDSMEKNDYLILNSEVGGDRIDCQRQWTTP